MPQLGFIAFLLVWASGADIDRVRRRGEVNRYFTAGIFVVINGLWAFVATFVVVGVIDRHSPIAARVGFALLAGALVFSIDRFLTGLPLTSNSTAQRAKAIVIRVFFALPWALFLANATDQVAYNPEITAQVIQDQSHQSGGLIEAAKQEYVKEVTPLNNDLAALKRATKAAGVRYGWASTMHNYALHHGGAPSTVAKWAAEMKTDWSLFQQASANEAANSKIINASILQYQAVEQAKIRAANNAITRSGGLLARQHALNEVRHADTGANDLYWEIFVIFVVVELIPAFGKALQGQSLSDVELAAIVRATTAAITDTEPERTRQLTYAMRAELTEPGARPASLRDYPVQLQVVGGIVAVALIAATLAVMTRHKPDSRSSQPPGPTVTVTRSSDRGRCGDHAHSPARSEQRQGAGAQDLLAGPHHPGAGARRPCPRREPSAGIRRRCPARRINGAPGQAPRRFDRRAGTGVGRFAGEEQRVRRCVLRPGCRDLQRIPGGPTLGLVLLLGQGAGPVLRLHDEHPDVAEVRARFPRGDGVDHRRRRRQCGHHLAKATQSMSAGFVPDDSGTKATVTSGQHRSSCVPKRRPHRSDR